YPKSTGSRGIHVYVPIVRGPTQKEVWTIAKAIAQALAVARPALITAEYRIAKRPAGRGLVDHNQKPWGRTPAPRCSGRPPAGAPLPGRGVGGGVRVEPSRLTTGPGRAGRGGALSPRRRPPPARSRRGARGGPARGPRRTRRWRRAWSRHPPRARLSRTRVAP